MNLIESFFKLIQLPARYSFGLASLGYFILFAPVKIAQQMGIEVLRESYRTEIGLFSMIMTTLWIIQMVRWINLTVNTWLLRRRLKDQLISELDSLSPESWLVVAYCLTKNERSVNFDITDPLIGPLRAVGILEMTSGVHDQTHWPFRIPLAFWKYLQKNKEQFFANSPYPKKELNQRLRELHQRITRYDWF